MNKLELEMKIQRLKFTREICKHIVDLDKNSLLMNRISSLISVVVAIFLTYVSTKFFKKGMLHFAIFDMLMAIVSIVLCVGNMRRIIVLKRELKRGKAELENIDSEIQSLEGMVF